MSKKEFSEYYKDKNVIEHYVDQRMATEYRRQKRAKELKIFLDLLNKKPGERVLEIGASGGFLTEKLGTVTALNTSKEMLKTVKEKNPEAKLVCSDMFKLPEPFKPESFDSVVSVRVFTHLKPEELEDILRKINKVLKKDGILVFDLEELDLLRQLAGFIYTDIFNLFRSKENKIRGYAVYQYNIERVEKILFLAGFAVEELKFLEHRIGRQLMFKVIKVVDIENVAIYNAKNIKRQK